MKNLFLTTLIFILSFLAFPVFAAEIYFETGGGEFGIEKKFEVKVFLDTEGENINAIEGEIVFPTNVLLFQEIFDNVSFVNFWIKSPSFNGNSVVFSGIFTGGYQGDEIYLFSIILKAKEVGEIIVNAENMRILKNEPAGYPVSVRTSSLKLQIKEQSDVPEFTTPEDKKPPEIFVPQIAKDLVIFNGKWFLVFATQDKDSGISQYEILETRKKLHEIKKREWKIAKSPYLLNDQELKSYIYVKAIDKAGNERIATLDPQNQLSWLEKYFLQIVFSIGIIAVGTVTVIFRKTVWSKLFLKKQNKEY